MPRTGLLREVAARRGITVSEAKKEAMRIIQEAVSAKVGRKAGARRFEALREVMKAFWDYVRTHKDFPSVEYLVGHARATAMA